MPSYICEKCGCIDNSACGGNYWATKSKLNIFKDEYANKHLLCVECTPKEYKDGSVDDRNGKWHNMFAKRHWTEIGKDEILKLASESIGNYTNAKDFFGKIEKGDK